MKRRQKNIIALSLLVIFLFPLVIKAEHHHRHFIELPERGTVLHDYHEKCAICNYELCQFAPADQCFTPEPPAFTDDYCNQYQSSVLTGNIRFTFLLRAPPVFIIL
jgi:hypothetical protein